MADYTYDWESWHRPDGRLIWVNPAVERLTNYTVADRLAMSDYPLPIVVAEDRDSVAGELASAREKTSGQGRDFRILARDGETRWMSLAWQPMYDSSRSYLGFRTSARDVTERRALRDQLRLHAEHLEQLVQERTDRVLQLEMRQRQMEKLVALGQLAAGVAHEINNPLAGMRNAFELIKSSLPPEHEHFELLALIDKEIERISGITHQMYQLYKRAPQEPRPFALTLAINEVLRMSETLAKKHSVRMQFEPPSFLTELNLVEAEVKQILFNLIRNAIQASSPDQTVTIKVADGLHEMVVHVKDQGSGIADEVLPHILTLFSAPRLRTHTREWVWVYRSRAASPRQWADGLT